MKLLDRLRALRRSPKDAEYRYPLCRENHRIFPPGFDGLICVWDIDKTYLASDIDSVRGMLKIPFEFAVDKRTVPGADNLLRQLRRPTDEGPASGLYFVSASPNQLRKIIEKKMLLDAVEHDGITLKDWTAIIRQGRLGKLREQIGYKLSALLLGRRDLGWLAREVLFGDDSESDALIYSLYADICAGRLRGNRLIDTATQNGVSSEDARYIESLSRDLPEGEMVDRVLIHTERSTSAADFDAWRSRLVACRDTFQMALILFAGRTIGQAALVSQGRALIADHAFTPDRLVDSVADLMTRGWLRLAQDMPPSRFVDAMLGEIATDREIRLLVIEGPAFEKREGFMTPEGFLA